MANVRGLVGWLAMLSLITASCSSATPEEQLANDFCAVVEDYASQDEDARSVFDVEDEYERLELRGTADGVNFDQAGAKIQLECPDALAVFLRDQQELSDVLSGIVSDLNKEYGLDE